jgi:hypothetical protein
MLSDAVTVKILVNFLRNVCILPWTENKNGYTVQISFDSVRQSFLTVTMERAK